MNYWKKELEYNKSLIRGYKQVLKLARETSKSQASKILNSIRETAIAVRICYKNIY